ncbi:DUF2254 domain-containing protein [Campylobacter corcagiensis]|uniref:DUF2254 domain-containing protein n=1 Tax=Campylobacter corcagiensis TaxID=1448857 RepID=A0A7M1LF18_9BACT|nr:DUF2254 family protein [Campylobacter corcagiensis]QKF64675.1 DUF2254 domain-containing membrane protein [Campylobacter corcagiensis]QOQ87159.1 DUF2254 domain-containing protein [Campylobacter corcagiensis]
MFNKLKFWLKNPANSMWVLPTIGIIISIFSMFLTKIWAKFIKEPLFEIEISLIDDLLSIIASSMLAVSTFSLSIMVSAFSSVSNSSTPRATSLAMNDNTTRVAIASFISAFIYAIISKVALGINFYEKNGVFLLFIVTLLVIIYLVIVLIRWVNTLAVLGRKSDTLDKIYNTTTKSLENYFLEPFFKCSFEKPKTKPNLIIKSNQTGYITDIDFDALQSIAQKNSVSFYILSRHGDFVVKYKDILEIYFDKDKKDFEKEQIKKEILSNIIIQSNRAFHDDPVFGMITLSEVAQTALSDAINDQGTAIIVINLILKIIIDTNKNSEKTPKFDRVGIVELDESRFISQSFRPIVENGVSSSFVLKRALEALVELYSSPLSDTIKNSVKKEAASLIEYLKNAPIPDSKKDELKSIYSRNFN